MKKALRQETKKTQEEETPVVGVRLNLTVFVPRNATNRTVWETAIAQLRATITSIDSQQAEAVSEVLTVKKDERGVRVEADN